MYKSFRNAESNVDSETNVKMINYYEISVIAEVKLMDNAAECLVGVMHFCRQGQPIDSISLKSALSIFAVEMFLTSIEVDGFDHLLGKWPIYFYKNFEAEGNI